MELCVILMACQLRAARGARARSAFDWSSQHLCKSPPGPHSAGTTIYMTGKGITRPDSVTPGPRDPGVKRAAAKVTMWMIGWLGLGSLTEARDARGVGAGGALLPDLEITLPGETGRTPTPASYFWVSLQGTFPSCQPGKSLRSW